MEIKDCLLLPEEYYNEVFEKDTIYLHHTAGSHRADWTIASWEHDKTKSGLPLKVATAYVIGGLSTRDFRETSWDGVILRAFNDTYWAHHLGTKETNNSILNKKSVAIEICNYGGLVLGNDGNYYNYVKGIVPKEQVVKLVKPFRGYTYYHAYTDKQLTSLKELLLDIVSRHPKINLKKGLQELLTEDNFLEINQAALKGLPGLWSHTNVRKDKSDIYPHPKLLELIKSF
jgi:hypothetical protein